MTTTLAFRGNETKAQLLDRLAEHRKLDQIVQGLYWDSSEHKGCAVGCCTEEPGGGHDQFPARWGIPVQIAHLMDMLFEAQDTEAAKAWPQRTIGAITEGADLSHVWDRFALWILMDETYGSLQFAHEAKEQVAAVGALFQRAVDGDEPSETEWREAAWAAWAARAAWASWAAWAARAARAAWAARAAEAARAAWAAWAARASYQERRLQWVTAACDELVRLLETAPVPEVLAA